MNAREVPCLYFIQSAYNTLESKNYETQRKLSRCWKTVSPIESIMHYDVHKFFWPWILTGNHHSKAKVTIKKREILHWFKQYFQTSPTELVWKEDTSHSILRGSKSSVMGKNHYLSIKCFLLFLKLKGSFQVEVCQQC